MIIGSGSNRNKNNSLKANFNVKQSTTFIHEFELYYVNTYNQEVPYDFTDSYLQFNIKSKYGTVIKQAGTINVIDNIVRLYIGADDLDFYGKYKYELVVTSSTNETSTLVEGEINIERSVVTTLQEMVKSIGIKFNSVFSIVPIFLTNNKFSMKLSSIYSIILNLDKAIKNQFTSNYVIEIINNQIKKSTITFNSYYQILLSIITSKEFTLSFSSLYTIMRISFIEKKYSMFFSSTYSVNLSENYSKTLSFVTDYTITNL